jgi:hypothetical protein
MMAIALLHPGDGDIVNDFNGVIGYGAAGLD